MIKGMSVLVGQLGLHLSVSPCMARLGDKALFPGHDEMWKMQRERERESGNGRFEEGLGWLSQGFQDFWCSGRAGLGA